MAKIFEGYHRQEVRGVVTEEFFTKYDDGKFDVKTIRDGVTVRDQKLVLAAAASPELFSKV